MLSERIKEFETASFNAKLRVTDLDKVALKCQLLPKQILASFLLLKDHHESEEKDAQEVLDGVFDDEEVKYRQIIKETASCLDKFTEFKCEFYALNEPIVNKDFSTLRLPFVGSQLTK